MKPGAADTVAAIAFLMLIAFFAVKTIMTVTWEVKDVTVTLSSGEEFTGDLGWLGVSRHSYELKGSNAQIMVFPKESVVTITHRAQTSSEN